MATHETPAGQFIELVNARVAQGHDYTESWTFVRRNNPSLYSRMQTAGAPKLSLGNSANASEIERLRAVIRQRSKQVVDLANGYMGSHGYTFERAWIETKNLHRALHAEIEEANRKVLGLVNAVPAPGGPAAPSAAPQPSVPPADPKALHEDFLMMPAAVWDTPEVIKLAGLPEGGGGSMTRQAWSGGMHDMKPAAFVTLLDVAAKIASNLFNNDVERARASLASRFQNIARAAVAGVAPAKDEQMAKALNVPA